MNYFMIRFLICNILICGLIVVFLLIKKILKKNLSSRMQYNLWYILLGLFAVPFITFCFNHVNFPNVYTWFQYLTIRYTPEFAGINSSKSISGHHLENNLINNFTLSVDRNFPSAAGYILFGIWVVGIFVMIILMVGLIGLFIWAATVDPIPGPLLAFFIAFPVVTIGGVLLALKERIKQIEGGEEDAARKY